MLATEITVVGNMKPALLEAFQLQMPGSAGICRGRRPAELRKKGVSGQGLGWDACKETVNND
jgi:hypothetical protein